LDPWSPVGRTPREPDRPRASDRVAGNQLFNRQLPSPRAKPTLSICVLCFFVVHIPSALILRPRPECSSGGWPSSEERPSFARALANFIRTQTLIPRAALQVLLRRFSFCYWFFSSLQGFLSAHWLHRHCVVVACSVRLNFCLCATCVLRLCVNCCREKPVLFSSYRIKKLEVSEFKLFSHGDFSNAPTRCWVKCL
jgi:hypothetical protein